MKVFHPLRFQGRLNKKNYFEGWYFKQVSENLKHVYSFIPGIALTQNEKHAFIQIIDGISGSTWNVNYPLTEFNASKKEFLIQVGTSVFSDKSIQLNIQSKNIFIEGKLTFAELVKYPFSVISPGIMGWYSFVPFMECKHGIGSVKHKLAGKLNMNGEIIDFSNGVGYIEKDWGTSFPESWIWLHCNTFNIPDCSLTFSVAKIPWLGSFFIWHICFLYVNKKFYRFATYNGSKITSLKFNQPVVEIELSNKKYRLQIRAVQNNPGNLKAPVTGEMNRIIKESVDADIEFSLIKKSGQELVHAKGKRGGMEIIEKIMDYFKIGKY